MHDDLLASRPEGASHNADICMFCVDKATQDSPVTSVIPPAAGGSDVSDTQPIPDTRREGHNPMSDISKETHEALVAKAVSDATSVTEKALETKTAEASDLAAQNTKLTEELAAAKADNERLNSELDTAQVGLKAANEKVTQLESDIAEAADKAAKAELATERANQVKNLKLYDDEYVAERASAWAEMTDTAWAERLDEWSKVRPASTETATSTDTASAMSGTSGELTKEPAEPGTDAAAQSTNKKPARRAALGLS